MRKTKILVSTTELCNPKIISGISSVVENFDRDSYNYEYFIVGTNHINQNILKITKLISSVFAFYLAVSRGKYDLVHLNIALNPVSLIREYIFSRICVWRGTKYIMHFHGGRYFSQKKIPRWVQYMLKNLTENTAGRIFLSKSEKIWLIKYARDRSSVNDTVISNPTPKFDKREGRYNQNQKLKCIFFGRLADEKNILSTMQLFNGIVNAELDIYGVGPLEEKVKKMAYTFKNSNFCGILPNKNILKQYDVFILLSKCGEGMPMAMLESLSAGLFPIVTNDGAMPTLIDELEFGAAIDLKELDTNELIKVLEQYKTCKLDKIRLTQDKVQAMYGVERYHRQMAIFLENSFEVR